MSGATRASDREAQPVLKATDCLRFTGYKPCEPGKLCEGCADREAVAHTTLLINLDNLGNVIQMTSLLPAISRAFPGTAVTWVTAPSAASMYTDRGTSPGAPRRRPPRGAPRPGMHGPLEEAVRERPTGGRY